jgi:hypothetical protein
MRAMRERRPRRALRELRLMVPDSRLHPSRKRVALPVVNCDRDSEDEALSWIEAVSEFDRPDPSDHETR